MREELGNTQLDPDAVPLMNDRRQHTAARERGAAGLLQVFLDRSSRR